MPAGRRGSVPSDHSSLSVIRYRLGPEGLWQVFELIMKALRDHKLIRGRKLGIDASDPAAVRRFDRNRLRRKTSNEDGQSPHDPDLRLSACGHGPGTG